jgi:hypothetical protein
MRQHALATTSAALLLAALAEAQVHTRDDLVLGQRAVLRCTAPPGGAFATFVLSFAGLGPGPCLPPHGCLSVQPPLLATPLAPPSPAADFAFDLLIPPDLFPAPLASQAVVFTPLQLLPSNALDGPILPLSVFDDGFDGGALAPAWHLHNAHLVEAAVGGGELHLRALAGGPAATWYAHGEGPLVHRVVRGDFTVVATVRSYRASNASLPPTANYNMGGISLRDPRSDLGPHDWLHVAVGGGDGARPIAVEDKSTDDSQSDLMLHPIAQPQGQVRATRQGATVSLFFRPDAAQPWTLLRSHHRPDLGPELQVGPNVFSWSPAADLVASFDAIAFTRP